MSRHWQAQFDRDMAEWQRANPNADRELVDALSRPFVDGRPVGPPPTDTVATIQVGDNVFPVESLRLALERGTSPARFAPLTRPGDVVGNVAISDSDPDAMAVRVGDGIHTYPAAGDDEPGAFVMDWAGIISDRTEDLTEAIRSLVDANGRPIPELATAAREALASILRRSAPTTAPEPPPVETIKTKRRVRL